MMDPLRAMAEVSHGENRSRKGWLKRVDWISSSSGWNSCSRASVLSFIIGEVCYCFQFLV